MKKSPMTVIITVLRKLYQDKKWLRDDLAGAAGERAGFHARLGRESPTPERVDTKNSSTGRCRHCVAHQLDKRRCCCNDYQKEKTVSSENHLNNRKDGRIFLSCRLAFLFSIPGFHLSFTNCPRNMI